MIWATNKSGPSHAFHLKKRSPFQATRLSNQNPTYIESAAWAAASLAIGTRTGEQLT
jgi:hypothetical protein